MKETIEIYGCGKYAWCETPSGSFIYGRSADEIVDTLNSMSAVASFGPGDIAFKTGKTPKMEYNR